MPDTRAEAQLTADLAEGEREIARLVQWVAKGKLVDDPEAQMTAAGTRRDHLRGKLARARASEPAAGIDVLPAAVRQIVSDLRAMLEAGRVEDLKRVLSRLVTSIEVHEDPRPGRERPGAQLVVWGNLEALLRLTGEVGSIASPAGTLTLLTMEMPAQEWRLWGRRCQSRNSVGEPPRAAVGSQDVSLGCQTRNGGPV